MRIGVLSSLGLLVVSLMAGCVAQDEGAPEGLGGEGGSSQAGPAGFSEETGGIEGQITDDEFVPVAGAEVGILDLGLTAATDEEGRFVFSSLDPRTYTLYVQKLGYESAGLNVDVVAGQAITVAIQLVALPVQEAHYSTVEQDGYVQCSIAMYPGIPTGPAGTGGIPPWITGVAVCGIFGIIGVNPPGLPPDRFLILWEVPEGVDEVFLEMAWQSTQASGRGLRVVLEHDDHPNEMEYTFGTVSGLSPISVYADEILIAQVAETSGIDCTDDGCILMTRVFAEANTTDLYIPDLGPLPVLGDNPDKVDAGLTFDQRFTQSLTSFFLMEKPEEFTALADA